MTGPAEVTGAEVASVPPALGDWLRHSVCPRAHRALVFFASARRHTPAEVRDALQGFLTALGTGRSALIVEAQRSGRCHREARDLAQELFVDLLEALSGLSGVPTPRFLQQTTVRSRRNREPPVLSWRDPAGRRHDLVTIAMSPHYRRRHPRRADRLCLVVTFAADVRAAGLALAERGIRVGKKAWQRAGRPYFVKELYAPEWRPQWRRRDPCP